MITHTHMNPLPLYTFIIQEYGLCGRKQTATISDRNVETQIGGSKMQHMMRALIPLWLMQLLNYPQSSLWHLLMVVQLQQTQTNLGIKTTKTFKHLIDV